MSTTLRIASIVSVLCVILSAFLAFGLAYNGDYIRATVCLAFCGFGVLLWRLTDMADEEYYRGMK
jgi:O-antigen/teichoic acid export membrane protein